MLRRLILSLLGLMSIFVASAAFAAKAPLYSPDDPLRSCWGLSFGVLVLENQNYQDFFDDDQLPAWTLRYDYRIFEFFRLGAAFSVTNRSKKSQSVTLSTEPHDILFEFSSFQAMGELYIRTELPDMLGVRPQISYGAVMSHVRVKSAGYFQGYDATWEEFRPVEQVRQNSRGWRFGFGLQRHVWANVSLVLEASRIAMAFYGEPKNELPPVSTWHHGGWRLELGFIQRF